MADIYETTSGKQIGQAQVRGSPGNVTNLTDRLTRKVLGVLLEKSGEQIPSVNLSSLTTSSLPALKAYLRGERHFRASEYGAAVEEYESAVAEDSTFALAYARLRSARFWGGEEGVRRAARRAYKLSGRLPRRERRIVRATYLWVPQDRHLAAADSLRRLSEDYPDDPGVWHYLGEVLYHGDVPRGLPEAEEAFRMAIELDSAVPQYHHHYVELAFVLHRDSSLAAERVRAHPTGPRKEMYKRALALVFGSESSREKTLTRLDSIPRHIVRQLGNALLHPTAGDLREEVFFGLLEREDLGEVRTWFELGLLESLLGRGQISKALSWLQEMQTSSSLSAS